MKKNLLWTMVAAVALASCSETELVEIPEVQEQNAIAFSTYLGDNAQSRAVVMDKALLGVEGFGVNAYYTGTDDYEAGDELNFMQNTKVTLNKDKGTEGLWEYSPVKYWPNNEGDKVSFFAYGPHANGGSENNIELDGTDIKFTVAPEVKNQVDLIYNTNYDGTINQEKPAVEDRIQFKFDHALARIAFTVEAAVDEIKNGKHLLDGNTRINVKKVALVTEAYDEEVEVQVGPFYQEGTLSLLEPEEDESPWTIDDEQGTQAFIFNATDHFRHTVKDVDAETKKKIDVMQLTRYNASEPQLLLNDSSFLMIIPQTVETFRIYIEYDVISEGYDNDTDTSFDGSGITNKILSDEIKTMDFEKGKAYNFNLILGMTSVKFEADVTAWDETTPDHNEWLPENKDKLDFKIADYNEQTGAHVFLIETAADLAQMRDNVNSDKTYTLDDVSRSGQVLYYAKASYRQTASFSLAEYENWVPIGRGLGDDDDPNKMDVGTYAFKGIYDGNGQIIRGLKTNIEDSKNYGGVGLFGMVDSYDSGRPLIKNLTVEDGNVTNTSTRYQGNAGGIAGHLSEGTIENCSFTGEVNGVSAGGIVGYLYGGTIIKCANGGAITSGSTLGGIAGLSMGGNIHACYNYGTLSYTGGNYSYNGVGGILGFAYVSDTYIIGCYNSASITTSAEEVSGCIVGQIFKDERTTGNAEISYCYYNDNNLEAIGNNGPGVTPSYVSVITDWSEAMGYMNYGLKANNIAYHYVASKVDDFPLILESGSVEGKAPAEDEIPAEGYKVTENAEEGTITYTVYTADGLYAWRAAVMNDDETMKDDDINLVLAADITLPAPADGQEYNWKPVGGAFVGNNYQIYKGNIDGGGKTITNLVIKFGNSTSGFIGKMENGTIKNLKLAEVNIQKSAYEKVAALLGDGNRDMTISGCEVVSGTVVGDAGLIGTISSGNVENCINRATVTNKGQYAGGVICEATIGCTITNCSNYGNVTLTSSGAPSYYAGGIVGKLSSSSTIKNCTNYCTSILPEEHVGYIVGTATGNSTLTGNKDEGNTGLPEAGDIS